VSTLYLLYGFAFLCLGVVLVLQASLRVVVLPRRVLLLLAAFGLLHGAYEWLTMRSLTGPAGLPPPPGRWGPPLLAVSFAVLALCGIEGLVTVRPRWRAARAVPLALLVLGGALYPPGALSGPLHHAAELAARGLLGFPGAVLAAVGLAAMGRGWRGSRHPRFARGLGAAAWALGAYAVFTGLPVIVEPFGAAAPLRAPAFAVALVGMRTACVVALAALLSWTVVVASEELRADLEVERRREEVMTAALLRQARVGLLFSEAVERAPDGIQFVDLDGRVMYSNQAVEEIYGFSPEELKGRHVDEVNVDPRFASEVILPALRATGRWDGEMMVKHASGRTFPVWLRTSLLRDAGGRPQAMLGIIRDDTERRRTEEELRRLGTELARQQQELEAVVGAMADGLAVTGRHGEILRINATAQRLLGLSDHHLRLPLSALVGVVAARTADGEPLTPERAPSARALRGETVRGEVLTLEGPPPHRRRFVSVAAVPLTGPAGEVTAVVATFTDVTRLRELQEQRDDLLRMISHDLRTPLSALMLQAQLVERALAPADPNRRRLEAILASAHRIGSMIKDLVDLARLESGQLALDRRPLDLEQFTAELRGRLAGALGMERVRVEIEPGLPPLDADAEHLERVVVNLLSNALKYSTPPSEVVLRVTRAPKGVALAVIDHGRGIAADELPHLFERFYRAPGARRSDGLGLGLFITASLVRAQGGRIEVESELGTGSTFRVLLPG
jgi:hypothetical protein